MRNFGSIINSYTTKVNDMKTKKLITLTCLSAMSLLLASCGPTPLNDEEFTDTAREVCSTLKTEIASLDTFDFTSRAEAYRRAADTLADLNITEQSAPQGTRLRSGLAEMADFFDVFGQAYAKVEKTRIGDTLQLIYTEDGSVYANWGDILLSTKLEIEAATVLEHYATKERVREAAISLGLEECAIE